MAANWKLQYLWGLYVTSAMTLQKIGGFSDGMYDG